jgi:hypothetical protein
MHIKHKQTEEVMMKKQTTVVFLLGMFTCFMFMAAGCSPPGSDNGDKEGDDFIKKMWGDACLIEDITGTGTSVLSRPCAAINAGGNAIAVWYSGYVSTNRRVFANMYTAGWGWDEAQPVDINSAVEEPYAALDSNGNAMVVWKQADGETSSIYAKRYVSGSGWGEAQAIETDAGNVFCPKVVVDGSGNAIAVWLQDEGTGINSMYANRYSVGSGWGTPELIENNDNELVMDARLACNAKGDVVVVWEQYDGTCSSIYANRYVPGSGWEQTQMIDNNQYPAASPRAAIDSNGNAVAAWDQYIHGVGDEIQVSRYVPGSGWGTPEVIGTHSNKGYPHIVIDDRGNIIVTWQGSSSRMYAAKYSPGRGWLPPLVLAQGEIGDMSHHLGLLTMDAKGNALTVWLQSDGVSESVYAARYVADVGWGTAQLLEFGEGEAYFPHLAMNAGGEAVVVWRQEDGSDDSYYAAVYR